MDLSVILPLHNETRRVAHALECLYRYLPAIGLSFEIILVENGSTDKTPHYVDLFAEMFDEVRALHLDQPGKGRAVREGMLAATGQWRMMADCDWSMPVYHIGHLWQQRTRAHVIIGQRIRTGEPIQRKIGGAVFGWMVRWLMPDIQDSQSGFKLFYGSAAEAIFRCQKMDGFAFDVETLLIARDMGYRIVEVPVVWNYDPDSRVSLIRDSWRMARDLWQLKTQYSARPLRTVQDKNADRIVRG